MELTQFHPSYFQDFRYVYPVVSRRANGVSIGVNLSPSKRCNFRCVYCQVDRSERRPDAAVDVDLMRRELEAVAKTTVSGDLFRCERFAQTPESKRVLRDFAFSGDGEPTLAPEFGAAVDAMIDVRKTLSLDAVKLTLITNATLLAEPRVAEALDRLAANNGEIWAKLDGGDEARVKTIDRTAVPFERILQNIAFAAKRWSVKIQTAALSWDGAAPTDAEIERYCDRVKEIVDGGGNVCGVQLYTVARVPSEPRAVALDDAKMDALAATIREKTGLAVDVFYSK